MEILEALKQKPILVKSIEELTDELGDDFDPFNSAVAKLYHIEGMDHKNVEQDQYLDELSVIRYRGQGVLNHSYDEEDLKGLLHSISSESKVP